MVGRDARTPEIDLEMGPVQDVFEFGECRQTQDGDDVSFQDGIDDSCWRAGIGDEPGYQYVGINDDAHASALPHRPMREFHSDRLRQLPGWPGAVS